MSQTNTKSFLFQVFYTISIDGKLIHKIHIKKPRTIHDVKVFAGDNYLTPANASYRNLSWESFPFFHGYTPAIVSLETIL